MSDAGRGPLRRSGAPAADVSASPHVAHAVAHHLRCVIQGVEVSFWRSFWRRIMGIYREESLGKDVDKVSEHVHPLNLLSTSSSSLAPDHPARA